MTYICENCEYYRYLKEDEYAGKIGTCHYNPPVYDYNAWNAFPQVKPSAFCSKWKGK